MSFRISSVFDWLLIDRRGPGGPRFDETWLLFVLLAVAIVGGIHVSAFGAQIPGSDVSGQLTAAGDLLRLVDTGVFKWLARLFAGLCIFSAGWALKEQRFSVAVICVLAALILSTISTWVRNLFEIGGSSGVFSFIQNIGGPGYV